MIITDFTQDGISHINISSKSKCFLGRFLAMNKKCYLSLPEGVFQSVGGYWYYLTTKERDTRLFEVHDWETELLATQLSPLPKKLQLPATELQQKIKKALDQKLKWSEYWLEEFTDSELPFLQYSVVDGVVNDQTRKNKWLLNHLEARRTLLQQRRDAA